MLRKELGLFLLILVIGGVTAFINPQFVSQVNLTNLANQIGLFGLLSIRQPKLPCVHSGGLWRPTKALRAGPLRLVVTHTFSTIR
jgi:hypothetical protein